MMPLCTRCGADIRLLRTAKGKTMPVNAEPSPTGNVYLRDGIAHVLKKDEQPPSGAARLMPHFATCRR